MMYEKPISIVDIIPDAVAASNNLDRWETPIDPDFNP